VSKSPTSTQGKTTIFAHLIFSFADGKAFVALVNGLEPGAVAPTGDAVNDMNTVFDYSHTVYKIPKLLDAELVNKEPDDLSIVTYVSYFRIKVKKTNT
jgi:hypothetical protein